MKLADVSVRRPVFAVMMSLALIVLGWFYLRFTAENTSAEVLANINKRPGEPDLYLIQRSKSLPDGAESERRDQIMRDKVKMTSAQLEAASGDRAKFRHVIGSSLLQVLNFR